MNFLKTNSYLFISVLFLIYSINTYAEKPAITPTIPKPKLQKIIGNLKTCVTRKINQGITQKNEIINSCAQEIKVVKSVLPESYESIIEKTINE